MDRGAWRAAVYGVAESRTRLKGLSLHAPFYIPVSGAQGALLPPPANTWYLPGPFCFANGHPCGREVGSQGGVCVCVCFGCIVQPAESQFPDQRLNTCPTKWKRRVQPLIREPPVFSTDALWPSSLSSSPSWDPQPPPTTPVPPRLRELDGVGETPFLLPAPAGPWPAPQTLTPPRPLAPPATPRAPLPPALPYRVHRDVRGSPHRSCFSGPAHPVPGRHCPLAWTPWPLPHHIYSWLLLQRPAVIASDPKPSWPKTTQVCCLPAPVGLESRCGHSPCVEVPSRAVVSRDVSTRVASVWPVRVLAGGPPAASHTWVPPWEAARALGVAAGSCCPLDGRGCHARWAGVQNLPGAHHPPSPCHCPISLG